MLTVGTSSLEKVLHHCDPSSLTMADCERLLSDDFHGVEEWDQLTEEQQDQFDRDRAELHTALCDLLECSGFQVGRYKTLFEFEHVYYNGLADFTLMLEDVFVPALDAARKDGVRIYEEPSYEGAVDGSPEVTVINELLPYIIRAACSRYV